MVMFDLEAGPEMGGSSPSQGPRSVLSTHRSHRRRWFPGGGFEKAMWCWDHVDWKRDWTQLRPLYKPLNFWQTGGCGDLLAVQTWKTSLLCVSLLIKAATCQSGVVGIFLPSLPNLCTGARFRFYLVGWRGSPRIVNQHLHFSQD